jgi:hypothetical protein
MPWSLNLGISGWSWSGGFGRVPVRGLVGGVHYDRVAGFGNNHSRIEAGSRVWDRVDSDPVLKIG